MKTLLEQMGIAWLGVITTLFVVATEIVVLRWTGFSLVGTSVNAIPVGAPIGGGIAASGYYFGAVYTHNRATPSLLVLMVLIAGLAYFLIYWLDYTHREVEGVRLRDVISFWEFVDAKVTNTQLVGRILRSGSIGVFGYVLVLVDFIGFLVGGFVVYAVLDDREMCPSCKLYLKSLLTNEKTFSDSNSAFSYMGGMLKVLAGPNAPVTTIDDTAVASPEPVSMRVSLELLGCPTCEFQVIKQRVAVQNDKEWVDIESLGLSLPVPAGGNIRSYLG